MVEWRISGRYTHLKFAWSTRERLYEHPLLILSLENGCGQVQNGVSLYTSQSPVDMVSKTEEVAALLEIPYEIKRQALHKYPMPYSLSRDNTDDELLVQ